MNNHVMNSEYTAEVSITIIQIYISMKSILAFNSQTRKSKIGVATSLYAWIIKSAAIS